jgi:hypothetical protein
MAVAHQVSCRQGTVEAKMTAGVVQQGAYTQGRVVVKVPMAVMVQKEPCRQGMAEGKLSTMEMARELAWPPEMVGAMVVRVGMLRALSLDDQKTRDAVTNTSAAFLKHKYQQSDPTNPLVFLERLAQLELVMMEEVPQGILVISVVKRAMTSARMRESPNHRHSTGAVLGQHSINQMGQ